MLVLNKGDVIRWSPTSLALISDPFQKILLSVDYTVISHDPATQIIEALSKSIAMLGTRYYSMYYKHESDIVVVSRAKKIRKPFFRRAVTT